MYIIDRLEGDTAMLEHDDSMLNVPRHELPEAVAEGDILRKTEDGWVLDPDARDARRAMLAKRRRRLLNGGGA